LAIGKTSLLPENDRMSVSLKEYLAGIDVSMGGRVAEELSEHEKLSCRRTIDITITFSIVYGAENVTSGASSDIMNATRTAQAMVKVSNIGLRLHEQF
jgi:ATP-dependent metalloprotease